MSRPHSDIPFAPAGVALLTRVKFRALTNHFLEIVEEAPVKVLATVAFIGLIWLALYGLFYSVFQYFQLSLLQSVVAIPLIFHFFFVALLVLLTLSNAILIYGALFMHEEAAYLLAAPVQVRSTVVVKFGESLFFSSWSLLLLGLPLMMAIAAVYEGESWTFYALFLLLFLSFVPIPGALGLLTAWSIARFLPRSARRVLVYVAMALMAFMIVWGMRTVRELRWINEEWLDDFFGRLSLVQLSILPSTWVTRGIEAAVNDKHSDALRYLVVTVANALFLSWLAVRIVSARFLFAFDRAGSTAGELGRHAVEASGGIAGRFFFFLPHAPRLIAAKDLRHFVRDPMQWSQLAILFGLMALYLLNMPRFSVDQGSGKLATMVPFLNLTAISFILATFTTRFVFPMVSLERRQYWLIGLLPVSRAWLLIAKFAFAFTVTFSVAAGVMMLASYILRQRPDATVVQLLITGSICFGLCGLAVGIGARLPALTNSNPARIASGLGGTINLIASVLLICAMLASVGGIIIWTGTPQLRATEGVLVMIAVAGVILLGVAAGAGAMWIGARHLSRQEF